MKCLLHVHLQSFGSTKTSSKCVMFMRGEGCWKKTTIQKAFGAKEQRSLWGKSTFVIVNGKHMFHVQILHHIIQYTCYEICKNVQKLNFSTIVYCMSVSSISSFLDFWNFRVWLAVCTSSVYFLLYALTANKWSHYLAHISSLFPSYHTPACGHCTGSL